MQAASDEVMRWPPQAGTNRQAMATMAMKLNASRMPGTTPAR